jgi:hypothetical protein
MTDFFVNLKQFLMELVKSIGLLPEMVFSIPMRTVWLRVFYGV